MLNMSSAIQPFDAAWFATQYDQSNYLDPILAYFRLMP